MQANAPTTQERIADFLDPLVATLPATLASMVGEFRDLAILAAELCDQSVPKAERMALAQEMIGG